jgi:hypothetical protein
MRFVTGVAAFLLLGQIVVTPPPNTGGGSGTIIGGSCTNQAVTAISTTGVPTCNSITGSFLSGSLGTITVTSVTGKLITTGTVPAVANVGANSCGTTVATITGNDNAGEITIGATSGTQCRITFTIASPNRWYCLSNNTTTANIARAIPVDATHVDLVGTFVGGDIITYLCLAR